MRSAFKVCFSGRTKLLARGKWGKGYKRIDEITVHDEVASRDENDPNGAMVWKKVEELFVRSGFLLNVNIQGRIIETTAEHPFYEYTKGWIAASDLKPYDQVATLDGQWATVDEVFDTGIYETVYNLRVADFHTYFVGGEGWGFAVWAHNAYDAATSDLSRGPHAPNRNMDRVIDRAFDPRNGGPQGRWTSQDAARRAAAQYDPAHANDYRAHSVPILPGDGVVVTPGAARPVITITDAGRAFVQLQRDGRIHTFPIGPDHPLYNVGPS